MPKAVIWFSAERIAAREYVLQCVFFAVDVNVLRCGEVNGNDFMCKRPLRPNAGGSGTAGGVRHRIDQLRMMVRQNYLPPTSHSSNPDTFCCWSARFPNCCLACMKQLQQKGGKSPVSIIRFRGRWPIFCIAYFLFAHFASYHRV